VSKEIVRSTQFRRDARLALKRSGRGVLDDLGAVLDALVEGEPLEDRHRDHHLVGWSPPARECHVRPDLLLVYRTTDDVLELVRLGSHSDLF